MSKDCLVCKGDRTSPLYPGILRCASCGFVFADQELTDEEYASLYQHNYFRDGEYSNYRADERILRKNFRLRLSVLGTFLDPVRHKRLFEIGSAYGFFLDTAKEYFDTVEGIDISSDAVRYARETLGLNVTDTDFLGLSNNCRSWDVVCMWDTIEHLSRPDRYIEKVSRNTEPGSLLAITTGDIDSFTARLRKQRWRLIHPPTHAHYFSRKTLGLLLDRYGFDVIYGRYCGFYRSLDQAAYSILVGNRGLPSFYEFLKKTHVTELSFYLNLYDIIYVIARKR